MPVLRNNEQPLNDDLLPVPFIPRLSHTRRRAREGHIPRPPNAFIIYRSILCNSEKVAGERDHRNISRIAGECWRKLSPAERAPYHRQAELQKEIHISKYPNYKYKPVTTRLKGVRGRAHSDDEAPNAAQMERAVEASAAASPSSSENALSSSYDSVEAEAPRTPELYLDRSASPPSIPTMHSDFLDHGFLPENEPLYDQNELSLQYFKTAQPSAAKMDLTDNTFLCGHPYTGSWLEPELYHPYAFNNYSTPYNIFNTPISSTLDHQFLPFSSYELI